jgi:hypothetical protein
MQKKKAKNIDIKTTFKNTLILTIAQKEELNKRFSDHENGIGISFTLNETLAMAKQDLLK